jgi:hypothetical protein
MRYRNRAHLPTTVNEQVTEASLFPIDKEQFYKIGSHCTSDFKSHYPVFSYVAKVISILSYLLPTRADIKESASTYKICWLRFRDSNPASRINSPPPSPRLLNRNKTWCPLTESNYQLKITNLALYHLTKGALLLN